MKYRIVEEGRGVYIESRSRWWPFWSRDLEFYSIMAGVEGPPVNYRTVEAAKTEIDRRIADYAKYFGPPRVTPYPA